MAGDWIKMRGNLWDDPRVAKIVDLTDSSEAAVVGALYWLWATADQHTEDGTMPGLTLKSIDRKTGVQGFAQALCDIGWLADHPEGVRIIDFEKHNGSSAKKRCQTAKRVANHTAANAQKGKTDEATNADSVSAALAREREEKEKRDSVTDVTATDGGADQAELTKAELWTAGKSLLAEQGMPKAQCGSFVGKLVKDYTDTVVIEAVRVAVVTRPADAASYLLATCQHNAGKRQAPNRQEALEARNRKVAEDWVADMTKKAGEINETV